MLVNKVIVSLIFILASAVVLAAGDESTQGSFDGQVTDGSELKAYNKFLDSLKESVTWSALGAAREGGALDNFKGYKSVSAIYLAMVKENSSAVVPTYEADTLGLNNISGFRKYAASAKLNPSFVANSETCGAALTFAYTTSITGLLTHHRPVYILRRTVMQGELVGIGEKINKDMEQDYQSIVLMCKNDDEHGLVSSLVAVYGNLNADIGSVLPALDKDYDVSNYPYVATVACGTGGGNINVRACFKTTDLKLRTSEGVQLYKIYNMDQAGVIDREGLHIKLPEHFSLVGQNDHDLLILSLVVKDRTGKVVYSDKQGQFGIVNISN